MVQDQCNSCGEIEVSDLAAPKVCTQCGQTAAINLEAQTAEIAKAIQPYRSEILDWIATMWAELPFAGVARRLRSSRKGLPAG
ncbi:hypothetical protein [Paracoccus litorisediminis]|uniref:Uncharacterized protein n=1 Tax=Paracoccus litorisediminis TaxID=2006130 RepID=A0A844HTH4_9RHOB|nr:hypothetical protein [Paracoccus litorisediminis]MTH61744.1 hypothetical protein [Paracoccus litorisediminis]